MDAAVLTDASVAITGRRILNGQMVSHARRAIACYGAGNKVGFEHHRALARDLANLLEHEYAAPAPDDQLPAGGWCCGQQAIHASNPATH